MKLLTFSPNKNNSLRPRRVRSRKGFSIVEVAIAMGVVTLLLTTFLGVFGPAQKNIQRALSTKDANRLKDALSNEMSILRSSDTAYTSSFDKAFKMIEKSHDSTKGVLMYQYKAIPLDDDNDGILPPFTGDDGIQGKDYIIQTAVRTLGVDDDKIEAELAPKVVDGPVFVVRMSQLIKDTANSAALTARDSSGITDPDTPGSDITDSAMFPKAVIAFRAEFFKLSANKFGFVSSDNWDFDAVGNAVTEVNMAIRR